jgi:hypothetical protein
MSACNPGWCSMCRAPFPGNGGNARITQIEGLGIARDHLLDS